MQNKMTKPGQCANTAGLLTKPSLLRNDSMATRKSTIKRPIRIEGDLAYIPLTKGYVATIDATDAHLVDDFNWRSLVVSHLVYAVTGNANATLLHRLITSAPDGVYVDHKNRDGLDNRRDNLRLATPAQNQHNQRTNTANHSGFKGVHFHKNGGKWRAQILVNGTRVSLGLYDTPEAAHSAYCAASSTMHGEFGRAA